MNCVVALMFVMLACAVAQNPDKFMQRMVAKMRREMGETAVGESAAIVDRYSKRGVSAGDAAKYVEAHNEARHRARPTPKDEPDMAWDASLATLAQSYADRCIWGHNAQRSNGQNYPYVGENLFVTTAQDGVEPSAAVEAWESEVKDYHFDTMKCNAGKMCGHYTQVVWHDSTHVGCGVKVCPTLQNSSFKKATLIVCNYGPGGNFQGEHPYEV
ncbi:peptidase inhibitor 16-like [Mizuhopecten yessoensis]|uniref:Peptidase inhibitor 16 n=1 Tax=Mizuhopecten yessoensis TaxID=6573 RepID=A0A210QB84_MIZYE|nr:peptidase inhibitor 16-like [Mizuhopecten yessoensis]OWF45998.1 Peptidase inhibitor 16 [Mizuhopecten yessoensis]